MKELRPCPFCGGKATIDYHTFWNEKDKDFTDKTYSVSCDSCGVSTPPWYKSHEEAIAAWNRRAEK